jgi:hypothetical protein
MTQDEIIEMAKQVGAGMLHGGEFALFGNEKIEAFAKLIEQSAAAKEREACAEVCKEVYRVWTCESDEEMDYPDPYDCIRAIRARGQA